MQEQPGYFILVLAVLAIALFLLPGQNLFAALRGNLTESRTIFEKVSKGTLTIDWLPKGQTQIGTYYDYEVTATANFKLTPSLKKDGQMVVIPIVNFKGVDAKADDIVLTGGESIYTLTAHGKLTARVPPKRFGSGGVGFIKGQECLFKTDGFRDKIFIATLLDVEEKITSLTNIDIAPLRLSKVCKAKFSVECKDELKAYDYLQACNDITNPDRECSQDTNLCNMDVRITVESVNCREKTASAVFEAGIMPDWQANEIVKLSLFRKSACVDLIILNNDLSVMREACGKDFLGTSVFETGLLDSYMC